MCFSFFDLGTSFLMYVADSTVQKTLGSNKACGVITSLCYSKRLPLRFVSFLAKFMFLLPTLLDLELNL